MICRVCGYEAEPGTLICPQCGAKLGASEKKVLVPDAEMSWNTIDFPKPKVMSDIEMTWPELRSHSVPISEDEIKQALDKSEPVAVMSEDASEGYFSKPAPAVFREEKPAEKPVEEPKTLADAAAELAGKYEAEEPAEPAELFEEPEEIPAEEPETAPVSEEPQPEAEPEPKPATIEIKTSPELKGDAAQQSVPPFWYTQKFTATGVMQTGPAWPVAPGSTRPTYPASATIETMTLSDPVPIMPQIAAAAAAEAAKKQAEESAPASFTLEEILEEFKGDGEEAPSGISPDETFYTFKKKNDEFQKLLDMEYDRFRAIHGEDQDPLKEQTVHPFVPEETVQAKDLSTFEKMLMENEPAETEETAAQRFFWEAPEEAEKPEEQPEEKAEKPAEEKPEQKEHERAGGLFAFLRRREEEAPVRENPEEPQEPEASEDPKKIISDAAAELAGKYEAEEPAAEPKEPAAESKPEEPAREESVKAPEAPVQEPAPIAPAEEPKAENEMEDGLFVIPTGDPSKYNIDEIEHTIRELQAQEIAAESARSERKKRLAAMAAAREAYFRSLDDLESKDGLPDRSDDRRREAALKSLFGSREEPKPEKPAEEKPAPSIEDASPLNIWDDASEEPTKEVPVGSILKALAAGGTIAAAAVAAGKAADKPADAVKTAAMGAFSSPKVTEDFSKTRIFRSLAESAEELAKRYEQPAEAESKAETLEDLIRKYEPAEKPAEEPEVPKSEVPVWEPIAQEAARAEEPAAAAEVPAEVQPEELMAQVTAEESEAEAAAPAEQPRSIMAEAEELAGKYETEEPAEEPEAPKEESPVWEPIAQEPVKAEEPAEAPAAEVEESAAAPAAEAGPAVGLATAAIAEAIRKAQEAAKAEEPAPVEEEPETMSEAAAELKGKYEEAEVQPEQPAEPVQEAAEELAGKYETEEPAKAPAAESGPAVGLATAAIAEAIRKAREEAPAEPEEEPKSLADAVAELAGKYEEEKPEETEAQPVTASVSEEAPAAAETAEAQPEKAETAEDLAKQFENFEGIITEKEEVSEPTHPFDTTQIKEAEEEEEDGDDEDEARPRHVFLKIIAVILIICALFEGAVLGLKQFAPESQITENAVQIEEGVGEAVMSFFNTVYEGVGRLFNKGGN